MSLATSPRATPFDADLEDVLQRTESTDAPWLRALRREAREHFQRLGLPARRAEDWLYTDVTPLGKKPLPVAPAAEHVPASIAAHRFALGLEDVPRLVFLNGRFEASLSSVDGLPEGVDLVHGAALREEKEAPRRAGLGRVADMGRHPFVALNTAYLHDGCVLRVADGVHVETPVQTLFLHSPVGRPVAVHPRLLVVAGEGSALTFVERYGIDCIGALAGDACLTNAVSEFVLGAGASVHALRIQHEGTQTWHVGFTGVRQARDSRYRCVSLSLGGALDRNEVHVDLAETGAECDLHGLYVLGGREHVDNHTVIRHHVPHCRSTQLFKGVLAGHSQGAFTGRVIVDPDAQQTVAEQANHNLILSDHAVAKTRPQLEIHADDVKCAHGATIGRLDEDALYYLRTRGLGARTARNLLVHAFASEIMERAEDERLVEGLENLIASRLEGPANPEEDGAAEEGA